MKLLALTLVFALSLGACGPSETENAANDLTRAQKDSIVASLPVPGAGGVGRAMEARDRANARTEAHDSIR